MLLLLLLLLLLGAAMNTGDLGLLEVVTPLIITPLICELVMTFRVVVLAPTTLDWGESKLVFCGEGEFLADTGLE